VESSEVAVRGFVERINAHDVAAILTQCTAEHRFVDSLGRVLMGRARLREAWLGYLRLFPDYRIEIETLVAAGTLVHSAGWASATLASSAPEATRHWRIPAAWRAEVHDDLIDLWQVYADNKPVYELLSQIVEHGS
jgi:hypothetical protein